MVVLKKKKKKKKKYGIYILCRLKLQYFEALKSGAPKMRPPAVAGIAGGVPTPLKKALIGWKKAGPPFQKVPLVLIV